MARLIGAVGFFEISALTRVGLLDMFENTIRHGLNHAKTSSQNGSKKCVIQ
jgi:hypothetical protein